MNGINTPSYRFQAFLLDVAERQFFQSGKLVPLTPKAFDVLAYLVANAGHLVLKDDLMQAVWPDSFVDEVNLPRTVHTLRRALGEGEGENKFIETIPTKGYRFVANVTIIDREEHTSESADVGPEFINSPEADGGSGMGTIRRFWFSPTVVVSVIFLLIVGVAGSYLFRSKESTTKTDGRRSIAVLPFENLTADRNQEYLVDGITENVLNNLSRLSGLRVVSRNVVFNYKGNALDLKKIAGDLGVDAIVIGNMKRLNDQMVIDVNLVDPSDGTQLWGKQFIKNSLDAVATPNEISQAVAENLRINLTDADRHSLGKRITESEDAFRLYLKGRWFAQVSTPESLNQSIDFYRQAIEKDPNFALAYSDMGMRYVNLGTYFAPPRDTMPRAREAALKALEIDNTLSDPHTILGMVALLYDWDWDKAKAELAEGAIVNLKSIEMFNCTAHILQVTGRAVDADGSLRSALKDDPLSISLATELGCNSYYAGRFEESITEYRNALLLKPDNFLALYGLARSLNHKKRYQEAVEVIEKAKEIMHMLPPIAVAEEAYSYAKLGRRDEALKHLNMLNDLSKQVYVDPFFIATIYLSLDDADQTFDWLEKAFESRSSLMPSLVNDPKWDDLRNDRRFQDLLPRIGFTK